MMTAGFRRGYPAISLSSLWSAPEQRLAVPEFADDRRAEKKGQENWNGDKGSDETTGVDKKA